ncbi:MAG: DEAD/DEAH box helicase [Eubacteriales bacterium]|nr:DEAD/DEAH box helicase [Eubacteriales bacterium]
MNSFQNYKLSRASIDALTNAGITKPTAIQAEVIDHLLNGRDVIAKAPTGTGKTYAFALPLLEKIDPEGEPIQALVLAPTRELALQIADDIELLIANRPEIQVALVYGGQSYGKQIKAIAKSQILVATPGRLLDHLSQRRLNFKNCRYIVLDEADRMLDMGFIDDVKKILNRLPKQRQLALFSATLSRSVQDISWVYQDAPLEFEVVAKAENKPQIEAMHCQANGPARVTALLDFCQEFKLDRALIFANMKQSAEIVSRRLQDRGEAAEHLHGGLSQRQREKILERFRQGELKFLVATDVAARGLDIEDIPLVVNYDLPQENENYIHRIGRTGRAGSTGFALSFYTIASEPRFRELLRRTKSHSELWDWSAKKPQLNWLEDSEIDEAALAKKFNARNAKRQDARSDNKRFKGAKQKSKYDKKSANRRSGRRSQRRGTAKS